MEKRTSIPSHLKQGCPGGAFQQPPVKVPRGPFLNYARRPSQPQSFCAIRRHTKVAESYLFLGMAEEQILSFFKLSFKLVFPCSITSGIFVGFLSISQSHEFFPDELQPGAMLSINHKILLDVASSHNAFFKMQLITLEPFFKIASFKRTKSIQATTF